MKKKLPDIAEAFEREALEDFIGLWQLVGAVKENAEAPAEESAQNLTLDLVRKMLSRGFKAGTLSKDGRALEPWPDQTTESIVRRIKMEWEALGHDPTVGDIVWFDREAG